MVVRKGAVRKGVERFLGERCWIGILMIVLVELSLACRDG